MIRLGLIGCGQVAETRHLPALKMIRDVQIVAVAEIETARLSRVAERFQIPRRYANYRALLNDQDVQAVAVCVPTQFHAEIAIAALEANKHVFIEKPLALSLGDCDQLIERAERLSRKAVVGFNLRAHRLVRQARTMIASGILGRIALIQTTLTSEWQDSDDREWRTKRESGGGVLIEAAIHHFDLMRFLLQSEFDDVFAETQLNQMHDESAVLTAKMTNGALVSCAFAKRMVSDNQVEIYGTGGRLALSLYRFDGIEFLPNGTYAGSIAHRFTRVARALRDLPQMAPTLRRGGDFRDSYRQEWLHFTDSIERDAPVECTLEDGRRALQVSLAAVHSASLGKPVRVEDAPQTITPLE